MGLDGKIVSIEPLNESAAWVRKNLLLNNFSSFEVLENAIGRKHGYATLYKKNPSSTIGVLDSIVNGKQLIPTSQIEIQTIDQILSSKKIEKVNMLKIDVDGFEYDVLLGCKESFKFKKIEKIMMEIHTKVLKAKGITENMIYSLLEENSFSIEHIDQIGRRIHIIATLN